MKFILTENKFTLSENSRIPLEERFLLTEATGAELAQKWTTQFLKTFDTAEAALNDYLRWAATLSTSDTTIERFKTLATQINTATTDFEITLRQPMSEIIRSLAVAKEELRAVIIALINGVSAVDETPENKDALTALKNIITELNTYYSKPTWTALEVKKLKEIIDRFTSLEDPLFDVSALEETIETIEAFKKDCFKCLELITTLKTKLPADFSKFSASDLSTYQHTVKLLIDVIMDDITDTLTRSLTLADFHSYQNQVKTLKAGYFKISQLPSLNTKIDVTSGGTTDWQAKLAKAIDKSKVIQEFIYTTWPKDAELVLQIKEALLAECEAYGFDQTGLRINPFISFISEAYLTKYRGKLTPAKYNVIHNLVSHHYLTGEDIAGKGVMGYGNVIFCRALYTLDPAVIKLYIKKQYSLLRAAKRPPEYASNAEMTFNIIYNISERITGDATKNSIDMALRPLSDIEQLEASWTGQISDTADDDVTKNILPNVELIKQIDTTKNAIDVLVALATKFSSNDKISAAVRSCTEAKKVLTETTTFEEIQKIVASVERLYKLESITASRALSLIKSILESDRFRLTKE